MNSAIMHDGGAVRTLDTDGVVGASLGKKQVHKLEEASLNKFPASSTIITMIVVTALLQQALKKNLG